MMLFPGLKPRAVFLRRFAAEYGQIVSGITYFHTRWRRAIRAILAFHRGSQSAFFNREAVREYSLGFQPQERSESEDF